MSHGLHQRDAHLRIFCAQRKGFILARIVCKYVKNMNFNMLAYIISYLNLEPSWVQIPMRLCQPQAFIRGVQIHSGPLILNPSTKQHQENIVTISASWQQKPSTTELTETYNDRINKYKTTNNTIRRFSPIIIYCETTNKYFLRILSTNTFYADDLQASKVNAKFTT